MTWWRHPLTLDDYFRSRVWVTRRLYFDRLRRRQLCKACRCLTCVHGIATLSTPMFQPVIESGLRRLDNCRSSAALLFSTFLSCPSSVTPTNPIRGDGIAVIDICLANSLGSKMGPDELLRGASTGSPVPPVIVLPKEQRWGRNVCSRAEE